MNSDSSSNSEEEIRHRSRERSRVSLAKKSMSAPQPTYTTRRQVALSKKELLTKQLETDKILGDFNPEHSLRERKKLNRKINPPTTVRRPPGALYDENGVNVTTGIDMCDCLDLECLGCFFECTKCDSRKCGLECRVHRKFMYDQIEYHGYDAIIRNPLMKS